MKIYAEKAEWKQNILNYYWKTAESVQLNQLYQLNQLCDTHLTQDITWHKWKCMQPYNCVRSYSINHITPEQSISSMLEGIVATKAKQFVQWCWLWEMVASSWVSPIDYKMVNFMRWTFLFKLCGIEFNASIYLL